MRRRKDRSLAEQEAAAESLAKGPTPEEAEARAAVGGDMVVARVGEMARAVASARAMGRELVAARGLVAGQERVSAVEPAEDGEPALARAVGAGQVAAGELGRELEVEVEAEWERALEAGVVAELGQAGARDAERVAGPVVGWEPAPAVEQVLDLGRPEDLEVDWANPPMKRSTRSCTH